MDGLVLDYLLNLAVLFNNLRRRLATWGLLPWRQTDGQTFTLEPATCGDDQTVALREAPVSGFGCPTCLASCAPLRQSDCFTRS